MREAPAGLWRHAAPLVLASTSSTRRALLSSAALVFEAERPLIDERAVEAAARAEGAGPEDVALRLAREKAAEVSRRRMGAIVVGADQTLALSGELFHKPASREEARKQLARLSGETHALHAGVAVARDGKVLASFVETARLTMRPLDETAIALYLQLAGDDVLTSVGGYQLEGVGVHLFERVEGDHATILGLPLMPLLAVLRRLGALSL